MPFGNATTNKYKNAVGQHLLRDLFFEMSRGEKENVIYTLKDWDHNGLPSLKRLYMETADLTEYRFATEYLDGVAHWDRLCECPWFKEYIDQWRKELMLKFQSEALARIIEESKKDSQVKFGANKYLLEQGWKPKPTTNVAKRGRPSKEEISNKAMELIEHDEQLKADMSRIMN